MKVLVTGATGNVGGHLVSALQQRGLGVCAAGRRPEGLRALHGDDLEVRPLDLTRPDSFDAALRGCQGLFLVRPPAIADVARTLIPFVERAHQRGVRHVVFLSVAGADRNVLVPHHRVETHLRANGPAHTLLRPGFFAQNLGDAYRQDIREDHRLYAPAGEGRVAFVDVRDVAEVAATVFETPGHHRDAAYTLTGPEAVSMARAAAILSEALGRPVRYTSASVVGYAAHLRRRGLPAGQIAVQTALHLGLRYGQAQRVTPTLQRLLGRRPRNLADYVRDHVHLWQR